MTYTYAEQFFCCLVSTSQILAFLPQSNSLITTNAAQTLGTFCKWQTKMNALPNGHQDHFDTAVLLTELVEGGGGVVGVMDGLMASGMEC